MSIVRSWREQKVMLKWMFPTLLEEDLDYELKDRESMLDKLETKLNKTRVELEKLFAEFQLH